MQLDRLFAAALVAAVPLAAQSAASYSLYGAGCNTGAVTSCITQNATNPSLRLASLPNEYAYPVVNSSAQPMQIVGFDAFTQSNTAPVEVGITGLFLDNSGAGAQAFTVPSPTATATGLMTVTSTPGWWATIFSSPVTVAPGECFWLGLEAFNRIAPPQMNGGSAGPAACFWRRPNYLANAWTASGSVYNPILRVRCAAPGSPVPTLTATGVPQLGSSMTLDIGNGTPLLPAFVAFALGDTQWLSMPIPVNLALFGVPTCDVWTSSDMFVLLFCDAMGNASLPLSVPNNPALAGFTFYNQVAATSPTANVLGLAFSNAGKGVLNP